MFVHFKFACSQIKMFVEFGSHTKNAWKYLVFRNFLKFILLLLFYFTILLWLCHTSTWIRLGCTHVPILNPPPTSLHIPSLWVIPVHMLPFKNRFFLKIGKVVYCYCSFYSCNYQWVHGSYLLKFAFLIL